MSKKKLVINCATCDARNATEETFAPFEEITVNAAVVISNPVSRELMNRFGVRLNCASVVDVPEGADFSNINGPYEIRSTDLLPSRHFLMVNGPLTIGPDTQKVLEQYVGVHVNGPVTCPESISALLGAMQINGPIICYPDGAIIMKRSCVVDRTFVLRAKNASYWAAKRFVMVDPSIDTKRLKEKGARFIAKEVIIAESFVEEMVDAIDEKAELIIVPDGTNVLLDDVKFDAQMASKLGSKLYVAGDFQVGKDAAVQLEALEYLVILGDAMVPDSLRANLIAKAQQIVGNVCRLRGRVISDGISCRVTKWLLEKETDGVYVCDHATVSIDEDIPKDLIYDRLSIRDVASVRCSEEQEDVVKMICEDVASIGSKSGENLKDMIKNIVGDPKELLQTKFINAANYVL